MRLRLRRILLGKNVTVSAADNSGLAQKISGAVEQVSFNGGSAYVTIGGVSYDAANIVSVSG
jgi:hypothetical protein